MIEVKEASNSFSLRKMRDELEQNDFWLAAESEEAFIYVRDNKKNPDAQFVAVKINKSNLDYDFLMCNKGFHDNYEGDVPKFLSKLKQYSLLVCA